MIAHEAHRFKTHNEIASYIAEKIGALIADFNVLSVASPAGELRLSGLPYAVGSSGKGGSFSPFVFGLAATATTALVGVASAGNTYAVISKYAAGTVSALAGDVSGGAGMFVAFDYQV